MGVWGNGLSVHCGVDFGFWRLLSMDLSGVELLHCMDWDAMGGFTCGMVIC